MTGIKKEKVISKKEKMFEECITNESLTYDFLDYISKGKLSENNIKRVDTPTFYKPTFDRTSGTFTKQAQEVLMRYFKFGGSDLPISEILKYVKNGEQDSIDFINYIVDKILDTEIEYLYSVSFKKLGMDQYGFDSARMLGVRGTWNKDYLKKRKLDALISEHIDDMENNADEIPF